MPAIEPRTIQVALDAHLATRWDPCRMARSDIDSPLPGAAESEAAVDLYWLPLGLAGISFASTDAYSRPRQRVLSGERLARCTIRAGGLHRQARFAIEITPVRAAAAEQ